MNKIAAKVLSFFAGLKMSAKEQNEEIKKLYPHALDDVKEKQKKAKTK